MVRELLMNIAVSIICAILATLAKKIWSGLKAETSEQPKTKKTDGAKLKAWFFYSLFFLVALLIVGFTISPDSTFTTFLKYLAISLAAFAFLFVWGAFDAAFEFYPPDEIIQKPSGKKPKNAPKK